MGNMKILLSVTVIVMFTLSVGVAWADEGAMNETIGDAGTANETIGDAGTANETIGDAGTANETIGDVGTANETVVDKDTMNGAIVAKGPFGIVNLGWFRFGPGGDGGRIFAEYGPQAAPILKLSDYDDPPRIQFQQEWTGNEANPTYRSWIGMAKSKSNNLAIIGNRVGIGTTNPQTKLHVVGNRIRLQNAGKRLDMRADGSAVDLQTTTSDLYIRSTGTGHDVIINPYTNDGKVGIGTAKPNAKLDVNGFTRSLGVSVNNGANTGVGRGLWLWHPSDPNHVIYSANPNGKSPANKAAVRGYFDAGHRLRLRTATGQGFLFENNKETALVDIDSDNGRLWTKGAIYAGNSDLYFTKTDHVHTEIGNSKGYAAIENAKNFDALMILGRAGTSKGRYVRLWDYLQVNGNMDITGKVGIGTTNPNAKLHIINAPQNANGNTLILGPTNKANLRLGYHNNYSWIQSHGGKPLSINPIGNGVGIGTTNPKEMLHVKGRMIVGGSDFILGTDDGRPQGTKKSNRALVHWTDDSLVLNWNGDFEGGVMVHGPGFSVSGTKKFLIDHPLDPEHKELIHSTLEGPEAGVFYRGEAQLSDGEATVMLPDYFEALTREEGRTVLLTPKFEGDEQVSMLAASGVKDGKFRVRMIDSTNPSQKFYWEVKAVRADVEILEVERTKTPSQ